MSFFSPTDWTFLYGCVITAQIQETVTWYRGNDEGCMSCVYQNDQQIVHPSIAVTSTWHCCAADDSTVSRWSFLLGTLLQMHCHKNAVKFLLRPFIPSLHVGGKTRLCWDYFEFSSSANLARDMPWFLLVWFITSPYCLSPFLCRCKCINTAT